MRIIARSTLREFWEKYADAEKPLHDWYDLVKAADWKTPQDVKNTFNDASIIGDNRIVFNIKGNDYRLVVHFLYEFGTLRIKWIGTHRDYDRINAEKVGR